MLEYLVSTFYFEPSTKVFVRNTKCMEHDQMLFLDRQGPQQQVGWGTRLFLQHLFNIFFLNNGHYPNLLKSQNIAMISKMRQTLNTLEQLDCAEDSQQGALSALFRIRSNLTILNCTNGKHTQYMGTHTDKIQNVSHACVVSSKENVFF